MKLSFCERKIFYSGRILLIFGKLKFWFVVGFMSSEKIVCFVKSFIEHFKNLLIDEFGYEMPCKNYSVFIPIKI